MGDLQRPVSCYLFGEGLNHCSCLRFLAKYGHTCQEKMPILEIRHLRANFLRLLSFNVRQAIGVS